MAKCIVCSSSLSGKQKKYCSQKCSKTSQHVRREHKKLPTSDMSEYSFKSPNTIEKKKRKCKKCGQTYNNRNVVQCPDCWYKYTRGNGSGGDIVKLSDLG